MKEFLLLIGLFVFGSIFVAHNFFDKQSANIAEAVPTPTPEPLCDYCNYRKAAAEVSSVAIAKTKPLVKVSAPKKSPSLESAETASLF